MRIAPALLALVFAACGSPQQLPVDISSCGGVRSPHGVILTAVVKNTAYKPITGLSLSVDFYHDFRFARLYGNAKILPALDPGEERNVTFDLAAQPSAAQGRAMRCFATHVSYLDETSRDVAPSR